MIDLEYDVRLQSSETLRFVIPADDPKADTLVEDQVMRWRGKFFYVDEIVSVRDGAAATIEVKLNAIWMRLIDRKKIGSFVLTAVGASAGLNSILAESEWVAATGVLAISGLRSLDVQDATLLDCVWRWAKLYNKEVVFDTATKTIDFVDAVGSDNNFYFRYGRNLQTIKRTARPPQTTRLYPFGKDDLNIAGHTSGGVTYIENYDFYTAQGLSDADARAMYRRDEILSDIDIVDSLALYERAVTRLNANSQPWVKYEATVQDLTDVTGVSESFSVGDTVRVFDSVFNWNFTTRVVRHQEFPLQPWLNKVELSTLDDSTLGEGTASRNQSTQEWLMFKHDTTANYRLRFNGTYFTNRLALSFVEGGEAVFGYDVTFQGVGTGTLAVSAIDLESGALVHPVLNIPYTNGQTTHDTLTWASDGLVGQYDFRIRMVATASVPGSTNGIDIVQGASRFWVLAKGATKQAPRLPNSQRFDYTGAVQEFTVPENVTEITFEVAGSKSGDGSSVNGFGGSGSKVFGTCSVLPGAVYDVYVGGVNVGMSAGWPDGGAGDNSPGDSGFGGGGSTRVIPDGGSLLSALVVAGAGGGGGAAFTGWAQAGGHGGFLDGVSGALGAPNGGVSPGGGSSQFSGGTGGTGASANGGNGSFGQGGVGGNATLGTHFPPGGGGGGWYGGGGGGVNAVGAGNCGGGGGGSGWVDYTQVYDLTYEDGTNNAAGYVIFSWSLPED